MTPGKHPLKGWKQAQMDTPTQGLNTLTALLAAAKPGETFSLALRTGLAGGIFAIDIDLKPDGSSGFENWTAFLCENQINDPYHYATLTAKTGGGGQHLIYKYPKNGDIVVNAVCHTEFNYQKNPRDPNKSCIDVRGEGGIIIVCPSRHKSGTFYQWLTDPTNSLREDTPSAILRAVSKKREARDPDSDFTPELDELKEFAERLVNDKKRPNNVLIGRDLRDVLDGKPIHVAGGAHEPFQSLTFRLALEYPRASAAQLMEHLAESIAEREALCPDGSCGHDDVFSLLKGGLEKCREKADHWESKLLRSPKTGTVINSQENVESFLRNDPLWQGLFAINARSARRFVMRAPPRLVLGNEENRFYPRALLDVDVSNVLTALERRYKTPFQLQVVRSAVRKVCAESAFDPFLGYLEQLPAWDGIGRVDTWLSVLGGAEDSIIHRAFGAIWLLQAVYRTLRPGCQADYTLILEGGQGIGKSTMLRALVPDPSLFDDGLKPIDHSAGKDNLIKLGGPAILELAELGALRKGDVEFIKAFLTAREDTYRQPFAEEPITMLRRCVFAGTTNSSQYLRDSTGNRRFFPVKLSDAKINIELVKANRDQIWAEALMRARRNEPAFLPPELEIVAAEVQSKRRVEDAWQELLENWLDEAEARIREVTCHDLSVKEPAERLGPDIADEIAEDPDKIASMFWLEKYDDARVPELDAEDVRLYGEKEHFSINCFMDHADIDEVQRPRVVQEVANTLKSMGYESVKWSKRDKYRNKHRWLRKNR
jgi:predicted P-loop ATPase